MMKNWPQENGLRHSVRDEKWECVLKDTGHVWNECCVPNKIKEWEKGWIVINTRKRNRSRNRHTTGIIWSEIIMLAEFGVPWKTIIKRSRDEDRGWNCGRLFFLPSCTHVFLHKTMPIAMTRNISRTAFAGETEIFLVLRDVLCKNLCQVATW